MAVRDLNQRGVDFVKVHDQTPRDAFFAIADEAAQLGLPMSGHVPRRVTVEEAAKTDRDRDRDSATTPAQPRVPLTACRHHRRAATYLAPTE